MTGGVWNQLHHKRLRYGDSSKFYRSLGSQSTRWKFKQNSWQRQVRGRYQNDVTRQSDKEWVAWAVTRGSLLMGKQEPAGKKPKSWSRRESWDHYQEADEAGEPGTGHEKGNSGRRTLEGLTWQRDIWPTEQVWKSEYMLDCLHVSCVHRWAEQVNEVGMAGRLEGKLQAGWLIGDREAFSTNEYHPNIFNILYPSRSLK